MSRSAGTGSPIWFMCRALRTDWRARKDRSDMERHQVRLTGRVKPNPSNRRNVRVSDTLREYQCRCGYVGWSNHKDLEALDG